MRTENKVDFANFIRISVKGDLKYKIFLLVGLVSCKVGGYIRRAMGVYTQLQKGIKSSQSGALTPEIMEEVRRYHEERPEAEIDSRQILFTANDLASPKTCQGYAARLLFDTLSDRNLKIRSALNIGCYSDQHFSYMAQKFPDIAFCSVDLLTETALHKFNRGFPKSPNWILKSGYALDLLKRGEIDADLVFMTSASLQFNNKELDLYLDEITKRARVLVIVEHWAAFSRSSRIVSMGLVPKIILPEDIPEDKPFTRAVRDKFFIYAHNYPAKLEKRGFKIKLSKLVADDSMDMYIYQLVGVSGWR
jgi:hypothetical protein